PLPRLRRHSPGIRFQLKRALAFGAAPAILATAFAAVTSPLDAIAKVVSGPALVRVEGPLANISSSGLALTPAFAPNITDYVLRCQAGVNLVQVTLTASNGKINVAGNAANTVVLQESLVENQAFVIEWHGPRNPGGTRYWVRCL